MSGWLTPKDAADRLGVSVKTIRRIYERGDIPAYKVCARVQLREVDVDGYLEACRLEPRERLRNWQSSANLNGSGVGVLRHVLTSERQGG
jgi:excisionase family DNA binding protein